MVIDDVAFKDSNGSKARRQDWDLDIKPVH
jgi:hypothetical protein